MSHEPEDPGAAVDRLQAGLDPLPYPERMRALAAWAREHAADARLGALLDELSGRGLHGRRLAAVVAAVGRAIPFLEACLADPDAQVRRRALKASLRLPLGDAAFERAMDDAPQAVRREIVAAVVAGGRTELAERLLVSVRELWGDEEAARLLPACGPEAVARQLPGLFPAVVRWRALGCRHPDLVLDESARLLADLPESRRDSWWAGNAAVFLATAPARPQRVLDLLERHGPARLPNPLLGCLSELLKAEPGRTIRLLMAPERTTAPQRGLFSRTALSRLAHRHPPELADLGRAWSRTPDALALLLRALPPSRRSACYDQATADQDLSQGVVGGSVLDALPRARAQAEARRMVRQATERGEAWSKVLGYLSHLPVAEARPRLLAATRRPKAEDRALAYPLLVRNAARSGQAAAVGDLLGDLLRLRNEQDPVRRPALAALAAVPPGLFTGAEADLLDRIVTDAVDARDSSYQTRRSLTELALELLREHAVSGQQRLVEWSLTTLQRTVGNTGGVCLGPLHTSLRRGQEFQVFEALRPWLEAGADKVDHSLTFSLAGALGRRARRLPALQELLWQAIQFGDDATVHRAVEFWLDDPATREQRALLVLELDPSSIVLPSVRRVLTYRRTDLLDALLADVPPYGRFLQAGTRWQLPVDGVDLWNPRQQACLARQFERTVDDAALPERQRAQLIRQAAQIPEHGFEIARRRLDSPQPVLAEAALGALVWTDRPAEALPLLLAHVADDRARVALYAATRATRFVAPSRLEPILRAALLPAAAGGDAPAAKVTSRKELVRLAATRLPATTAAALLAAAFELPGQHPDVRAACVPVAIGLLPAEAAWGLLERAAEGPSVTQAAVLRTQPSELREADRARYARLVARVSGSDDPETAADATGYLARWAPWCPDVVPLLLASAVDLDNRASWRAAADGLVDLTRTEEGPRPLLEALARLVAAEAAAAADGPDAEPERDRPARQRVDHVTARLSTAVTMRPSAGQRAAAQSVAGLLSAVPDFRPQGVTLFARALDLDQGPQQLTAALVRLAELHGGRPALAVATAELLRSRLNTAMSPGDPLVLLGVAQRFAAEGGYPSGMFALALTKGVGGRTGWPADWRALLRELRREPRHADVREAALAVRTSVE